MKYVRCGRPIEGGFYTRRIFNRALGYVTIARTLSCLNQASCLKLMELLSSYNALMGTKLQIKGPLRSVSKKPDRYD